MVFVDRYSFLRDSLLDVIEKRRPDRVGVESPAFGELYSEGMYGVFLYINEALRKSALDVVFVSPSQLKPWAREIVSRPKGWKMEKPDMVEAAKAHSGTKGNWDHNEADAYLIAALASRFWDFLGGVITEADLSPVEVSQFTEIRTPKKGKHAGETIRKGLLFREDDRFFLWSKSGVTDGSAENAGAEAPSGPPEKGSKRKREGRRIVSVDSGT